MTFRDFIKDIIYHGLEQFGKFYSSYRGVVTSSDDPDNLGRIKVRIPSITLEKEHTKWVYPKGMFSGNNYGSHILPQPGDLVWIEFEHGKVEFPVWSHAYYSTGQKPEEFINHKVFGFKSPSGQLVIIDDRDGEVYINLNDASGSNKRYTTPIMALNGGNNGGFVKVKELTEKLNNLEDKMNNLLSHYEKHIHIDPLTGYTGAIFPGPGQPDMTTLRPLDISKTKQADIENEKILH